MSEIDLLPGALSERVTEGGTVGPTLRCLLAKQFAAVSESGIYSSLIFLDFSQNDVQSVGLLQN